MAHKGNLDRTSTHWVRVWVTIMQRIRFSRHVETCLRYLDRLAAALFSAYLRLLLAWMRTILNFRLLIYERKSKLISGEYAHFSNAVKTIDCARIKIPWLGDEKTDFLTKSVGIFFSECQHFSRQIRKNKPLMCDGQAGCMTHEYLRTGVCLRSSSLVTTKACFSAIMAILVYHT